MKDIEGKNSASRPFLVRRKQIRWGIVCILLLLLVLECCSVFVSGYKTLHRTQMEWTYCCQEEESSLVLPAHLAMSEGEIGTLSATLPLELTSDDMLCVYSNELLGHVRVESSDTVGFGETEHLSKPVGDFYFFPLNAEQAGKNIRIDVTICHKSFPDAKLGVWVGPMAEIIDGVWDQCLVAVCLTLVVGVLGLISIVLGYCYRPTRESASIQFAGGFLLVLAFWGGLQMEVVRFIIPNSVFLSNAEAAALMGLPILIALTFRPLTSAFSIRYDYNNFLVLFGLYVAAVLAFDHLGISSISSTAVWSILFFCVFVVYVGVFGFLEFRAEASFSESQQTLHFNLLLNAVMCILLAVCFFLYFGTNRFQMLSLVFGYISIDTIVFLIFKEMGALQQIQDDLYQSRITLLLSQIQPHFLYNTLNSMRVLIRTDAEAADKLLYNFSHFLRNNMVSINHTGLIPFSKELEMIRSYVYIEEVCFPKINIQFDIQVQNFFVPPLSVQPLVENAIKHGVKKRVEGGTVWISSYETEEGYCIEIRDNGVGFAMNQDLRQSGGHGLNNIRSRLEYQCGARLQISAAPGEGCDAKIIIPK